jgi:DNA-binding SARP family transcriptional activator
MVAPFPPRPDAPTAVGALRLHLLGGFRVEVEGRPVPPAAWRLRKAQGLVKLLALAPGCRLPREQALDLLWPDLAPDAAANNLRVAVHAARRALAPVGLALQGDALALRVCEPMAGGRAGRVVDRRVGVK